MLISCLDQVFNLLLALKRFETLLEPLLKAASHSEVANTFKNTYKVFKGAMTFLVESAIIKEFIHSILFSTFNESF